MTARLRCGSAGERRGTGGATLVTTGGTAVAQTESYAVPSDGVIHLKGHGWGHGHGMAQYGAQGAALQGRSADEIMAKYYPGTDRLVRDWGSVRVLLARYQDRLVRVAQEQGLKATDTASGASATLTTPSDATSPTWRVVTDATGLRVQYPRAGGEWVSVPMSSPSGGSQTSFAGPIVLETQDTSLRLFSPDGTSRDYRGQIRVTRDSTSLVHAVDVVPMDSYLYSVVPSESSQTWRPAALQAQAIAARSYAAYYLSHPRGTDYDICDSTSCQVYSGAAAYAADGSLTKTYEAASTTAAVDATTGVVRAVNGAAIFAEFSASNGGWAAAGSQPYLQAFPDAWDNADVDPFYNWTADVKAASIQAAWPAVGTVRSLSITGRDGNGDWGGRITAVTLDGVDAARAADIRRRHGQPVPLRDWGCARPTSPSTPSSSRRLSHHPSRIPQPTPQPSTGPGPDQLVWHEAAANAAGTTDTSFTYAPASGAVALSGDWDGNGTDTPGVAWLVHDVWQWQLSNSPDGHGGELPTFGYGPSWCRPIVGDWDGNGTATPGLVCPQGGQLRWRLSNISASSSPTADFRYGPSYAVPVVGDWNGDHKDGVGIVRPVSGQLYWQLNDATASGVAELRVLVRRRHRPGRHRRLEGRRLHRDRRRAHGQRWPFLAAARRADRRLADGALLLRQSG